MRWDRYVMYRLSSKYYSWSINRLIDWYTEISIDVTKFTRYLIWIDFPKKTRFPKKNRNSKEAKLLIDSTSFSHATTFVRNDLFPLCLLPLSCRIETMLPSHVLLIISSKNEWRWIKMLQNDDNAENLSGCITSFPSNFSSF